MFILLCFHLKWLSLSWLVDRLCWSLCADLGDLRFAFARDYVNFNLNLTVTVVTVGHSKTAMAMTENCERCVFSYSLSSGTSATVTRNGAFFQLTDVYTSPPSRLFSVWPFAFAVLTLLLCELWPPSVLRVWWKIAYILMFVCLCVFVAQRKGHLNPVERKAIFCARNLSMICVGVHKIKATTKRWKIYNNKNSCVVN